MLGLGYRREMADWDWAHCGADFFEVVPENWVHRERSVLYRMRELGFPIRLHGVSLNLGGHSPICPVFLQAIRALMDDIQTPFYSDHLAASGDAHQLYDLFPIPLTETEAKRVAARIMQTQDSLKQQIAIENSTWYTNVGDMNEADFIKLVCDIADCQLLLDVNNLDVNFKNHQGLHGSLAAEELVRQLDLSKVAYLHVAGHEYDHRFDMYIDTHSQPVTPHIAKLAKQLQHDLHIPILLEWDHDLPNEAKMKEELAWIKHLSI